MKRLACYATAAGICVALTAPLGAHWTIDPESMTDPPTGSQPDAQRQRPTIVNEPDGQHVTITLSDPAKPATLEMNIVMGSVTVKGVNRKDVLVEARPAAGASRRPANDEPPPAGLRRLTQGTPFDVEEDRNTVSIDLENPARAIDFTIEVPIKTNLDIETVQGAISVEGVDGELEVDSVNGAVTLANVGGCVVAHSVNGKLVAAITRTNAGQPMAFTSMNGTVDVTLPAAVKANFKLRSDQGDVYTDFDLQTRAEPDNPNPNPRAGRRGVMRTSVNIDHAVYGAVNGGGPDFEIRTFNGNVYVRKGK